MKDRVENLEGEASARNDTSFSDPADRRILDLCWNNPDFVPTLLGVKRHSKLTPDRRSILTPLAGKGLRSGPLIAQP